MGHSPSKKIQILSEKNLDCKLTEKAEICLQISDKKAKAWRDPEYIFAGVVIMPEKIIWTGYW